VWEVVHPAESAWGTARKELLDQEAAPERPRLGARASVVQSLPDLIAWIVGQEREHAFREQQGGLLEGVAW
jgi:hypothetical protein